MREAGIKIDNAVASCRYARLETAPRFEPHVDEKNVKAVIDQGFTWLMPKPERTNAALALGRKLSK